MIGHGNGIGHTLSGNNFIKAVALGHVQIGLWRAGRAICQCLRRSGRGERDTRDVAGGRVLDIEVDRWWRAGYIIEIDRVARISAVERTLVLGGACEVVTPSAGDTVVIDELRAGNDRVRLLQQRTVVGEEPVTSTDHEEPGIGHGPAIDDPVRVRNRASVQERPIVDVQLADIIDIAVVLDDTT